ncbi:MAG TPA: hypothetical protein VHW09_30335 [Bryobacteraceae bacterium]|jgi:hypothetical protein|nr:hypothetical protein [Bryobacteraceae bacterium]
MKLAVKVVIAVIVALLPGCVFAQQPIKTTSELITSRGRQEISLEEARDLLKAFLKLPGGDLLQEDDPHYPDGTHYPAFHFFTAILGASPGPIGVLQVRYYAVDRQTGDVWNAVICQTITSPSLTKLQVVLRRRIGLTDAEYRTIKRQGPLCEPGYPRVAPGK